MLDQTEGKTLRSFEAMKNLAKMRYEGGSPVRIGKRGFTNRASILVLKLSRPKPPFALSKVTTSLETKFGLLSPHKREKTTLLTFRRTLSGRGKTGATK